MLFSGIGMAFYLWESLTCLVGWWCRLFRTLSKKTFFMPSHTALVLCSAHLGKKLNSQIFDHIWQFGYLARCTKHCQVRESLKRALKIQLKNIDVRSIGESIKILCPKMDVLTFPPCIFFEYRTSASKRSFFKNRI